MKHGTGGIRTLDTLAGTPDFKGENKGASRRQRRPRRRRKAGTDRSCRIQRRLQKKKRADFSQGVTVYVGVSLDCEGKKGLCCRVERMTLHPRVTMLSTLQAARGEAFVVPCRVAYRELGVEWTGPWRYSCAGHLDGKGRGDWIGDGEDAAALAWLLEGEVRR